MAKASGMTQVDDSGASLPVIRRGIQATPELVAGIRVTMLAGIAFAAGQLATPVVIQLAIDRGGITSGDVNVGVVTRLALLGIAVVLGSELLGMFIKRRLVDRAERALRRLRVMAFDKVHQMSLQDHNEQATGVLVSRVTSDVDALIRFADWGLFTWLVQPVVILGIFIVMAVYSWQLALLAVVTFLPVFTAMRWVRKRMGAAHDARRTAVGDLLGAFSETLNGAEVIRAYHAEDRIHAHIVDVSDKRYRAGLKANIYMSGVYVVGDLVGGVMLAVLAIVGVTQRDALGLTAGELVAILAFTTLLQSPIAELGESINNAQEAVAGWRKVLGLLDKRIETLELADGALLPAGPLGIEADSVSFSYRDGDRVLRDVSVTVQPGQRVAVVGETGSGKSTFARLVCRLADPATGTINVGNVDLSTVSADQRRRSIRIVPQDGFLFDTSVRENIRNGRAGATDADIDAAVELLGLGSWVQSLPDGLDTPVGERGTLLSVGERQLVSFARAGVADPGLLILDEATSSVDPQTDVMLTQALERLSEGRTVMSIAHRLSTAQSADLVLVFDAGELIEQGSHDELVAAGGLYSDLFAAWTG